MKLLPDEAFFLRHWMHEELRYRDGPGPAKRLQFENGVVSADLATLIAAAIPAPADQQAAAALPLPLDQPLVWPWTAESLQERLLEARRLLAKRVDDGPGRVPRASVVPPLDLPVPKARS